MHSSYSSSLCLLVVVGLSVGVAGTVVGQPSEGEQTKQLRSLLENAHGRITIPAGTYHLNETLEVRLAETGPIAITGDGPVTLVMQGAGPALRIVGTITGTANPQDFSPEHWRERMPLVRGLEIVGDHPEADGIELRGTMQASLSFVDIRRCRHGIRLVDRNRNVIISGVHVYENSGVGIYLDEVNLHQINVANSHISYNVQGGIVVRGGNVRNLHVTGCDIEANMTSDGTQTDAANILIDQTAEDCSAAEVAITGCTIQHSAHYSPFHRAPGGANIRILGRETFQPNMITITGNVLSDTETHLHLRHVSDTTIVGNTFFTTEPTDILAEDCQRITLANCIFNPRESESTGQNVLRNCTGCLLNGLTTHNLLAGPAAIQLSDCRACRVQACLISGSKNGVQLKACQDCTVSDNTVYDIAADGKEMIAD